MNTKTESPILKSRINCQPSRLIEAPYLPPIVSSPYLNRLSGVQLQASLAMNNASNFGCASRQP